MYACMCVYKHTHTLTHSHSLSHRCVCVCQVLGMQAFSLRMCFLTTECVLLLQNVFSYYRMCSLKPVCQVLGMQAFSLEETEDTAQNVFSHYRMCSLTTECVLLGVRDAGIFPGGDGRYCVRHRRCTHCP